MSSNKENDGYLFWKRVDDLRTQQGISLKDLIENVSMTYSTIRTQRSINTLPKTLQIIDIAKVLGTSVEYLVTGEELKAVYEDPIIRKIKSDSTIYEAVDDLVNLPPDVFPLMAQIIQVCLYKHIDQKKGDTPQHA